MTASGKRIKICGLTRKEDILAVNTWQPDYAGFVFAPGKRKITCYEAQKFRNLLLPEIGAVGVFVNSPLSDLLFLARHKIIDLIQLHGDEDQDYILKLKDSLGPFFPVIKAIRVQSVRNIEEAVKLPADYLLFDTYTKDVYGGSGKTFDWSIIPPITKPWFLAGGIHSSNIKEAMKTEAFCLDLSSSLETHGRKDPEKIKEIIQIVRSENQCQKEDSDNTGDNLSPKH